MEFKIWLKGLHNTSRIIVIIVKQLAVNKLVKQLFQLVFCHLAPSPSTSGIIEAATSCLLKATVLTVLGKETVLFLYTAVWS